LGREFGRELVLRIWEDDILMMRRRGDEVVELLLVLVL